MANKLITGLFMVVDEESPDDAYNEREMFNEYLNDMYRQVESVKMTGEKNMVFDDDGGKSIYARVFAHVKFSKSNSPIKRPHEWPLCFEYLGEGQYGIARLNTIEESDRCDIIQSYVTMVNACAFVTVLFYDGR